MKLIDLIIVFAAVKAIMLSNQVKCGKTKELLFCLFTLLFLEFIE